MTPTILSFGFRARSGKGECCEYLASAFKGMKPLRVSFASDLRSEIHAEMHTVARSEACTPRDALRILCEREGCSYDRYSPSDKMNPHSKQRSLLQSWGMRRRAECANYWVNKVAERIAKANPSLVLIDDVRFQSEATWVKSMGGLVIRVDRPVANRLKGAEASHISEHELEGYAFDYVIENTGSKTHLHKQAHAIAMKTLQTSLF